MGSVWNSTFARGKIPTADYIGFVIEAASPLFLCRFRRSCFNVLEQVNTMVLEELVIFSNWPAIACLATLFCSPFHIIPEEKLNSAELLELAHFSRRCVLL